MEEQQDLGFWKFRMLMDKNIILRCTFLT